MPRNRSQHPVGYARLTPAALNAALGCEGLNRDDFVADFRDSGGRGQVERFYGPLLRGEPAPTEIAMALVDHLIRLRALPRAEGFVIPVHPNDTDTDWGGIEDAVEMLTAVPPQAGNRLITSPAEEIPQLAKCIVVAVGRMSQYDPLLSDAQQGERTMGHTLDSFEQLLARLYAANREMVQYGLDSRGCRVAIGVMAGVTQGCFDELCQGKMNYVDIAEKDLMFPAKHVAIIALGPVEPARPVDGGMARAALHCGFRMLATLTNGIKPFRPAFCAVAGDRLAGERLRRFGFSPTGYLMKGTSKEMLALRHYRESSVPVTHRQWLCYEMLRVAIKGYRRFFLA
ncbi:hypothetical protein R5W24_000549 [Gemmata sp. JC717]|uniref:hypothetical protein n=1 Tax=Gemmata algarum TaxID=2975278 RepID=UPI0021BAA846|nr:hypothetical protein [Gemmata algarum]MDY3551473.1 hypothetical protein [Gemmata algarum]